MALSSEMMTALEVVRGEPVQAISPEAQKGPSMAARFFGAGTEIGFASSQPAIGAPVVTQQGPGLTN